MLYMILFRCPARLRRSEHPETRAAIQRMVEQHSKGQRKKTKESEEAKQSRKKEQRDMYELPKRLVNESVASDAADKCEKWRRVSPQISADDLPEVWYCSMNTWDKNLALCTALEDK